MWISWPLVIFLMYLPFTLAKDCHIKVKAYEALSDDKTGFIEVNGNYIEVWEGITAVPLVRIVLLDGQCEPISTNLANPIGTYLELEDMIDLKLPVGSFIVGATQMGFPDSVDYFYIRRTFAGFGLDLSNSMFEDPLQIGVPPPTQPLDLAMFIIRRGYPSQSRLKLLGSGYGPRIFDMKFDVGGSCVAPLPPSYLFSEEYFGIHNTNSRAGVNFNERNAMVDETNYIACETTLIGWEFIPYTSGTFYAAIFSGSTSNPVHWTRITVNDVSYSQYQEPYYVCLAEGSRQAVHREDTYSLIYEDQDLNAPPVVKRAYSLSSVGVSNMPRTSVYPCTQVHSWLTDSSVFRSNAEMTDPGSYVDYTFGKNIFFSLALRPILDLNFVFACQCSGDNDCQSNGDLSMRCVGGKCSCKPNTSYNRHHNKCLYRDLLELGYTAYGKSSAQYVPSQIYGPSNALIDEQYDPWSYLDGGSCYRTEITNSPYLLLESPISIDLHAVSIRASKPLDPKATLYSTRAADENIWNRVIIMTEEFTDGMNIQKIKLYGPWPWGVYSDTSGVCVLEGSYSILNRVLNPAPTVHHYDLEYSNVGQTPYSVCRIEHVGILSGGPGKCVRVVSGNLYLSDYMMEDCTLFYISRSAINNQYYISILQGGNADSTLYFNSATADSPMLYGAQKTAFQMKSCDASKTVVTWNDLLVLPGIHLVHAAVPAMFVNKDPSNDRLVLQTGQSTCLHMVQAIKSNYPRWEYDLVDTTFTDTYQGALGEQLSFDSMPVTDDVCLEVNDAGGLDQAGFIIMDDDISRNFTVLGASKSVDPNQLNPSQSNVLVRASVPGLKDFEISVADYLNKFDGISNWNLTRCHKELGASPPGELTTFSCDRPLKANYVVIHGNRDSGTKLQSINICDVDLHYPLGPHHGDVCLTDADCYHPTGDHNMFCHMSGTSLNHCVCKPGFYYYEPAKLCHDVDECRHPQYHMMCYHPNSNIVAGLVDGECHNTIGSYKCICPDGYYWDQVNRGCRDINETEMDNCGCEHHCINKRPDVDGGLKYECYCHRGYSLSYNRHSCEDINECALGYCTDVDMADGCAHEQHGIPCIHPNRCQNSPGSYQCLCPLGYRLYEHHCIDIDECDEELDPGHRADCEDGCTNMIMHVDEKRFECDCHNRAGFMLNPIDERSCIDIDECLDENECTEGSVHEYGSELPVQQAMCHNTVGSYKCDCMAGYHWDPLQLFCYDINECKSDMANLCEYECHNTLGSYHCTCPDGYIVSEVNGHSCEDINECDEMLGVCGAGTHTRGQVFASCHNLEGSYECVCPEGYRWSPALMICQDNNECDEDNPCEDICENSRVYESGKHYECSCSDPGLTIGSDGKSCVDIDECANDNNLCSLQYLPYAAAINVRGECFNTYGSYKCVCPSGYSWYQERTRCETLSDCITRNECDSLRITMCVDATWDRRLLTMQDPFTQQMSTAFQLAIENIYTRGSSFSGTDLVAVAVEEFYRCGSIGIIMNIKLRSHLSVSEKSHIVRKLMEAIKAEGNTLLVDSTSYHVIEGPIYMPDSQVDLPIKPDNEHTVCDYEHNRDFCKNHGECIERFGSPYCKCRDGFHGQFCEHKISGKGMSAGIVAGIVAAVVVVTTIIVSLFLACCCQQRQISIPVTSTQYCPKASVISHVPSITYTTYQS